MYNNYPPQKIGISGWLFPDVCNVCLFAAFWNLLAGAPESYTILMIHRLSLQDFKRQYTVVDRCMKSACTSYCLGTYNHEKLVARSSHPVGLSDQSPPLLEPGR